MAAQFFKATDVKLFVNGTEIACDIDSISYSFRRDRAGAVVIGSTSGSYEASMTILDGPFRPGHDLRRAGLIAQRRLRAECTCPSSWLSGPRPCRKHFAGTHRKSNGPEST